LLTNILPRAQHACNEMRFSLSLAIKQQLSSQICPFGSHKNAARIRERERRGKLFPY
jgi:hypothetical protein